MGLVTAVMAQPADDVRILSLDDCLTTALANNLPLQRAGNNALIARATKMQAMANFLPDLNARWNYNLLFGTFWDNIAAKQVTEQYGSNPNINSSLLLFNGFANHHLLKATQYSYAASLHEMDNVRLSTKSSVMTAYLSVIMDKENLKISERRLELLEAQLTREVKRESVGVGNMETVYRFRSQVANERLNLVNSRNQLQSDLLQLIQLLQMDVDKSYDIEPFEIDERDLLTNELTYSELLSACMAYSPALQGALATKEAAYFQYKRRRSARYPSINFYGQYGSRYSSQGAANPYKGFVVEKAPYMSQMDYNNYKYVELSVSIPLFTQLRTQTGIQTAKLQLENAELDVKQATLAMTNTVQKLYLDLVSAQQAYRTARENMESMEQSYHFMKTRFETGNTDFYTFLESLNNKNQAEMQLVNARYSIVFRKKILDLYRNM